LTEHTAAPSEAVAFIGLGAMGMPMAARLLDAGFTVHGADSASAALETFARRGGKAFARPAEACRGVSRVITMLPTGAIVRDVLLGAGGVAGVLAPGALVIDMSSSAPLGTRALAEELKALGIALVDAPVSGGVRRAADGTLSIMVGGDEPDIARARPLFEAMGRSVFSTGPVGSGHAVKALNNYVSAAGLQAACEAALIARAFGIDGNVLVDVLNASTGRNNSTEVKMKPFILSGSFASGFSMALMAKDLATAAELAEELGLNAGIVRDTAAFWSTASRDMGSGADHTEIYRHIAACCGIEE
jgi:3-hydroxyisobutyrate dehydrogenase